LDFPLRLPEKLSSGVRPAQEARCAGAEPAHVGAGFGDGVLGGAAAPAGHRFGLLQLLLMGASSRSITSVSRVISALTRSMRASMVACSVVKNSAPSRAASSSAILRRARVRASWASALGLRSPGDEVVHDVPAGHPVQVGDHRRQLDRR
jgi:hypothetical protein